MARFVSPNDMLAEAKKQMLEGREPVSREDWCLIMNFVAANVDSEVVGPCCKLFATLFNMPLSDSEIIQIMEFQLESKRKQSLT